MTGKPVRHAPDHLPGGFDPIPGLTSEFLGGPGLPDQLHALGFGAIWPLDDGVASVIGRDISGNALDLSIPATYGAPTWQQAPLQPGTESAFFDHTTPALLSRSTPNYPSLNADFTALIFVKRPTWLGGGVVPGTDLMGQGIAGGQGSGLAGWSLTRTANNAGDRFVLFIGASGTPHTIVNANAVPDDIAYFLAATRDSGVWTFYLDGLSEGIYTEGSYLAASGGIWVGGQPNAPTNDMYASWGAINATRALSGAEILDLYNAGIAHGFPVGRKVWTSLGDGSEPGWQDTVIEVEY